MRVVVGLLRAFVFFTLFAFALNNQQAATVRWFFGVEWRAPMVIVVLVAFAGGCAIGVLAMLPSWWRQRRVAQRLAPVQADGVMATAPAALTTSASTSAGPASQPPRAYL